MNYSINAFIDELVEREAKGNKRKSAETPKQNIKNYYLNSMQRGLNSNFVRSQFQLLFTLFALMFSIVAIYVCKNIILAKSGIDKIDVIFGNTALFVCLFIALGSGTVTAFLIPKFFEQLEAFIKRKNYINAIGRNPNSLYYDIFKSKKVKNTISYLYSDNPLNMYVVNEDEKIAYRLYEFVDLNNSTVDRFNFVVPNHLIIKHKDFEPNEAYKVISNKMNFEAIGEFIYRSYNDIKAIEHARYKTAVKDLPTHQQDTQTAMLVNETNK